MRVIAQRYARSLIRLDKSLELLNLVRADERITVRTTRNGGRLLVPRAEFEAFWEQDWTKMALYWSQNDVPMA